MIRPIELKQMPPRVYVVGDIHGRVAEVEVLLAFLEQTERLQREDLVVFIGDYIDRGANSREVIDLLLAFQVRHPATIFLRGNHEDMLLGFLGVGGRDGGAYLHNGGATLLTSYGIDPQELEEDRNLAEELAQALPQAHFQFLQNTQGYVVTDEYVFVHAGLNPLRDLRAQVSEDLFWIRDEFISNLHYFRRTVVFGHTPYEQVLFHLPYKIGIDTGLVYGNMLSCIEVQGKKVIQVKAGETKVKTSAFPGAK